MDISYCFPFVKQTLMQILKQIQTFNINIMLFVKRKKNKLNTPTDKHTRN